MLQLDTGTETLTEDDVIRIHSNGGVGGRHDDSKGFYDADRAQKLLRQGYRMCKVNVWASKRFVNGIQTVYSRQDVDEEVTLGEHRGYHKPRPHLHTLELQEDEQLVGVTGSTGALVDSLVLTTSTGRRLEVGNASGGDAFDLMKERERSTDPPPSVMAFYGGFGGHLHNIGAVFVTPISTSSSHHVDLCLQHLLPPPVNKLLVKAAEKGNQADVEALLRAGADVNYKTARVHGGPETALGWAVKKRDLEMVRLLLDRGASVDARLESGYYGAGGRTPLLLAVACYKIPPEIVSLLVERGASLDAKDDDGDTALSLGLGTYASHRVCLLLLRAMASRGLVSDVAPYLLARRQNVFQDAPGIRGAMATARRDVRLFLAPAKTYADDDGGR